jgi:hypothetical protein
MEPPSFKYLSPENYNKLDSKQLESLVNLTKFHIDSFDWLIDQGLRHAIKVTELNQNFQFKVNLNYFSYNSEFHQLNSN